MDWRFMIMAQNVSFTIGGFNITIGSDLPSLPSSKRTGKGRSLLEALDSYTVIDIETTGLDPRWENIIEVAALRIENCVVVDRFQSLINPEAEIDAFITDLTGITNEMLLGSPLLPDIFPHFIDFVGSGVVVAHNANFDINFIYDDSLRMLKTEFKNDFIDTMRLSRRLFKDHSCHSLAAIMEHFNISASIEHRALSDAMSTYECYEHMKKYAENNAIAFSSLYPKNASAKDVKALVSEFNENTSIFGKVFVFTGTLEKMLRRDAMQRVVDMGGLCADNVTKKVNYLVLGNNDYCSTLKDGKSTKQRKAEQLKLSGVDIEILSENVFYDMLSEGV
jgi:DNA polymerase-3 subunit epsilon